MQKSEEAAKLRRLLIDLQAPRIAPTVACDLPAPETLASLNAEQQQAVQRWAHGVFTWEAPIAHCALAQLLATISVLAAIKRSLDGTLDCSIQFLSSTST